MLGESPRDFRSATLPGLILLLGFFAPAAAAQTSCPAVELRYDDNEQLVEKRSDTNQDCRYDENVYYFDEKPERAERDRDFDGRFDLWIFYNEDGSVGRQEQDTTGDGEVDRWVAFRDNLPATQLEDRNADGKADATLYYVGGEPDKLDEDSNFDGRADRWVTYQGGEPSTPWDWWRQRRLPAILRSNSITACCRAARIVCRKSLVSATRRRRRRRRDTR